MKKKFVIEKLPRPEHHGDWHDKPLKWVAKCPADPVFTQKFSTREDAELFVRCVRRTTTFNEACRALLPHLLKAL